MSSSNCAEAYNSYQHNVFINTVGTYNSAANFATIKIKDAVTREEVSYRTDLIEKEFKNQLEKYENKLQGQKVHISRGDRIKGSRVHGRRRKIAIPKGFFRNKKGVVGFQNRA